MFDLTAYLSEKRKGINHALDEILDKSTFSGRLSDAMKYAVTAGGKRLRPILCVAAAEAVGDTDSGALLRAACALELIHTYSLIHDDLPAMDNDVLRRGKPTCHIEFDAATAILAGDALLTLSFEVLTTAYIPETTPLETWLFIIQSIAGAAGPRGMVEGQMRDVAAEGRLIAVDELEAIHRLKTGALITASVIAGAAIAGATPAQTEQLQTYAQNIGIAFQVTDDILNVEGDMLLMGKSVGTDQAHRKNTFPSICGMAASKKKVSVLVDNALQALSIFDSRAEPLRAIATYIIDRKR
ncbi:MAG: polyprenyl synthetase family protein [Desulfobacterales bacterium]|jgi:geranylgeranyl diphosphate synthase type II|nr:polyprenyl synthetase family protein [Desulfobacterales bacterium]